MSGPLSINEINLLQGQVERLTKQNKELQKENVSLQGIIDAYKMSENEVNEIIVVLKGKIKTLKEKHLEWVKKAKEGMDAQEYCLQDLEKDCEKYRETLGQIFKVAQKLRTKTDYHSQDEVNKDLDSIMQLSEVQNE